MFGRMRDVVFVDNNTSIENNLELVPMGKWGFNGSWDRRIFQITIVWSWWNIEEHEEQMKNNLIGI